jgi:hyperosmotically inducible protein
MERNNTVTGVGLLLLLAVVLAGCSPYMAAVSLTTQAYGIATDVRSVSTQAADTAIEAQIKTALLTSPVSGTASITVYCRQGEVVLAGMLPRRAPAGFAAVQIARGTAGVRRVETFYVDAQPDAVGDFALKAQIKTTLIADPRLTAGQVDVGVYAGHVVLVGVVDSWQRVEDFREDVRSVPGVLSVRSFIQVGVF